MSKNDYEELVEMINAAAKNTGSQLKVNYYNDDEFELESQTYVCKLNCKTWDTSLIMKDEIKDFIGQNICKTPIIFDLATFITLISRFVIFKELLVIEEETILHSSPTGNA